MQAAGAGKRHPCSDLGGRAGVALREKAQRKIRRKSPLHNPGGCGIIPLRVAVAQWIERWVADPKAVGSSPIGYTPAGLWIISAGRFFLGEVSERLMELVSKTSEG